MGRFKVTVSERAEAVEADLVAQQCIPAPSAQQCTDQAPASGAQVALQCIDAGTTAPAQAVEQREGGVDLAPLSD